MTPRQRFLAALHGQSVDRPPLAQVAAMTILEVQESTGCFMPEAHLNPEQLVTLSGVNHDLLGFDAVTFLINFFSEPAVLGVEMNWGGKTTLPTCASQPWQCAEDAQLPTDFLKHSPMDTNLECLRLAKARYGDTLGVLGKIMGPLSMVQMMHGVQPTMMLFLENPDLIRHFLDIATDCVILSGNAQFDQGIDAIVIGEGGAGAHMLSPELYAEFLLPYHQRLMAALNGPTVLHICGDILPRLDMLAASGCTCFNFDWAIPPEVMVQAAAGKFSVMGNINTSDLLNGSPADIRQQCNDNLAAGTHLISPGCAISPNCPKENLLAMRQAINEWPLQQ